MMTEKESLKYLVSAIFERAVQDYRELRACEKDDIIDNNESQYGILEIENFLCSQWGYDLLSIMDVSVTPIDILHKLQSEPAGRLSAA